MPAIYMPEASHTKFRVGNNIKSTDQSGSQSHITITVRYSVMNSKNNNPPTVGSSNALVLGLLLISLINDCNSKALDG